MRQYVAVCLLLSWSSAAILPAMAIRPRGVAWGAAGLVLGLAIGGVAYAVVVAPDNAGDKYYACVSSAGVVKSGTIKLNTAPTTCPSSTDVVHSWAAGGPTGPSGATGATGPQAAGPTTRVIRVTDQSFSVSAAQVGPVLGPVDTSECRSISVHWSGANMDGVYVYDVDPESGDQLMSVPYKVMQSYGPATSAGGSARPAWANIYPYDQAIASFADAGGAVGPRTSVQFAANSPGGGTIRHVWLDCVPWT